MPLPTPFFKRELFSGIRAVELYVPGRGNDEVAKEFGLDAATVLKLASAENPLGPSPLALAAMQRALAGAHQYPDMQQQRLRERVAAYNGIDPKNVFAGAGETEIMSLIIRTFSTEAQEVLTPLPGFPMYELYTRALRRRPVHYPLDDAFDLEVEALLSVAGEESAIVFITTPNNPTSKTVPRATIEELIERLPNHAVLVVDEAYNDYSNQPPCHDLVRRCERLIVLRTFSKAFGLAGMRVGYAIADAQAIDLLRRASNAWNLSTLASAAAIAALDDTEHLRRSIDTVRLSRSRLVEAFASHPSFSIVREPEANFILVKSLEPRCTSVALFKALLKLGVIVKDCAVGYRGLGRYHLRIDVPRPERIDELMGRLDRALAGIPKY
ncbi:MAG: histidinol-phosphate transaminase [Candidatus Tectomicrobia bacterium]|nr:histidinol-phosphate transaminase [Candidatus Tectomicrobia bacterium]